MPSSGHNAKNRRGIDRNFICRRSIRWLRVRRDQHDRFGRNSFLATGKAELFGGLGFYVDIIRGNSEVRGDIRNHGGNVSRHARLLRDDSRVYVHHMPAPVRDHGGRLAQQLAAIHTFITRVAVRKMSADVAQCGGAYQSIADCMQQHVRIRVAVEPAFVRNRHAADDELAPGFQRMRIESLPYSHDWSLSMLCRTVSANARSCGYVTLRLRLSPFTSFGCRPRRSTAADSSVAAAGSIARNASSSNR